MGVFSALFSKNKRKWLSALEGQDKRMSYIIVEFFIKDNLSFELYIENQNALELIKRGHSLELHSKMNDVSFEKQQIPKPTKTFANTFFNISDIPLRMYEDSWFYAGYPDVAHWISQNAEKFDRIIGTPSNDLLSSNGEPTLKFYRYIIDKFKSEQGKLELAVS